MKRIVAVFLLLLMAGVMIQCGLFQVFAKEEVPTISNTNITLKVGKKTYLRLRNAKGSIKWKSTNEKCVSINKKGLLKARKKGKAIIKAINKRKIYRCKVTVIKEKKKKKPKKRKKVEQITPEITEEIPVIAAITTEVEGTTSQGSMPSTTEEPIVRKPLKGDGFTFTQYGQNDGRQLMFYIIRNEKTGQLIVVDGGYEEDSVLVRRKILEWSDTVDAWIITHPHPDHVGAFNKIYQDPRGITIKNIYTIEMDYDTYEERKKDWDDFGVFQTFYSLTKDQENIQYMHTANECNVCGLDMKVFHAYDDTVAARSNDICNDGSMMFQLKGEKDSFLFCADTTKAVEDGIIEQFGDELASEYCQMSHHGNSGLDLAFYNKVHPKIALFDAPHWLFDNVDEKGDTLTYSSKETRQWMQTMGAQCYSYKTAPNTFTIH